MTNDINGTLLHHLATGSGAASLLRHNRPKIVELARQFFETRTDIRRLTAAQDVANEILLQNDLTDLIEIRDVVAKQELRRQIRYGKQQDHTAHTVYLYFLGLWLYDNLPKLASAVGTRCQNHVGFFADKSTPLDRDTYFLLQWTYASLLHDIGYAFQNLELDTREDRQLIDRIYSWDWVKKQVDPLPADAEAALRKAHDAWTNAFGGKMRPGTAVYAPGSYIEILERLAEAPWLGDLVDSFRGKDIFTVLDNDGSTLRDYAFEVASHGYGGNGACVDHAVASGLLLYQYTSFWYWIMSHVRQHNTPKIYCLVAGPFDYNPQNLVTDFVAACRSVAFHNVQPATQTSKVIIPRFTISDDPITCLAILCDELQRWDRYPAGSTHLDDYRHFSASALESDDIALTCNGTRENPRPSFVIRTWADSSTGSELLNELRTTIAARLPGYSELVDIEVR